MQWYDHRYASPDCVRPVVINDYSFVLFECMCSGLTFIWMLSVTLRCVMTDVAVVYILLHPDILWHTLHTYYFVLTVTRSNCISVMTSSVCCSISLSLHTTDRLHWSHADYHVPTGTLRGTETLSEAEESPIKKNIRILQITSRLHLHWQHPPLLFFRNKITNKTNILNIYLGLV